MTGAPTPRRKRSQSIVATGLMATAAVSIGACDSTPSTATWDASSGREVDVATYSSLAECTTAGAFTADECNTAYLDATADNDANGPRFADAQTCEARYGVAQCVPRNEAGGGTSFMPLIAGFMIGQALSGGGGYGYRGAPLYREDEQAGGGYAGGYGGGYVTRSGTRVQQDYYSGRTKAPVDTFQTPVRAQSRSAVVSRSGFGGGGRSRGG